MGEPKERLDFMGENLLARMVRLVGSETSGIIVCASRDQNLPELPVGVIRVDDQADKGPIEGLLRGLTAAREQGYTHAFVAAVDLPLLRPALIGRMCSLMHPSDDAVVASYQGFRQPLAALYRVQVVDVAVEMVASQQYALLELLNRLCLHELDVAAYADIDPQGHSFLNINKPEDFRLALQIADAEQEGR